MLRHRSGTLTVTLLGTAALGLAGGWLLAQGHRQVSREALFARSSWRRFAALGWLERHGDAGALPLLRDYLGWEREPLLRNRARKVLARLEVAA